MIELIRKWNKIAEEKGVNLVYLFTVWNYSESTRNGIKNEMNCVVAVSGIEKRAIIGQYFSVVKAD
ncbi:MAG: GTP-binding protein, partial [Candidatus Syntropharchaeia archaeon]